MKKVLLLGANGMLGHAIYKVLRENYELTITTRDFTKSLLLRNPSNWASIDGIGEFQDSGRIPACRRLVFDAREVYADYALKQRTYLDTFVNLVGEVDYVINALGVTIPHALANPALTFFVNAALPHILARQYGEKLIHITTDCAYAGTDGRAPYFESSVLSPTDFYGVTKSLGEPRNCLTLRTSIIGRELSGHFGLLEWFLNAAKNGSVKGYTDHLWNGLTTYQYARVCDKIMTDSAGADLIGLRHIFSTTVSKYEMLLAFKKKFNIPCEIIPTQTPGIDRRLGTHFVFNDWLKLPTFQEMIDQMPEGE